jgi:uncharacterized protein YjbJ (UPF0337 family)
MNRDEVKGKAEALKGKAKQAAGDLTDDPNLHDEGVSGEAAGKTKDARPACRTSAGHSACVQSGPFGPGS